MASFQATMVARHGYVANSLALLRTDRDDD
jgi:hypothetical protein